MGKRGARRFDRRALASGQKTVLKDVAVDACHDTEQP